MLCLWCLAGEGREVERQADRPCPRCNYTGDWDGDPVFTDPPRWDLKTEAWVSAQRSVAQIMYCQDAYDPDAN
jgi:hypothetical protein